MNDLQERLDILREKHGIVGCSLAVLHEGAVHAAASGLLNLSTGVEATTDSVFQIGSITKAWTATVLMQLVDEGKLDLDAPLRTYLPELRLASEETAERVTTRHLLTHTSGIDGDHFLDTGRGDDVLERYVESLAEVGQIHPLGATFSYCNTGFSLAGRLIEVLTGNVWDTAMRERLFQPLGLQHTMTLPEDVLRFRAALGHVEPPDAPSPVPAPVSMPQRSAGPAGLISSTAADVVEFARLYLNEGLARHTQVLSSRSTQAMLQPQVAVPDPSMIMGAHWGLGWSLYDAEGGRLFGHDGGTIGQSALLRIAPDAGFVAVLLTNGGGRLFTLFSDLVGELLHDYAGITLPPPPEPPASPPAVTNVDRFTGRYERIGSAFEVSSTGDSVTAVMTIEGPAAAMFGGAIDLPVAADDPAKESLLVKMPLSGWTHGVFSTLPDGTRCLHIGGRAYLKAG